MELAENFDHKVEFWLDSSMQPIAHVVKWWVGENLTYKPLQTWRYKSETVYI
jgi:hypothetical protein